MRPVLAPMFSMWAACALLCACDKAPQKQIASEPPVTNSPAASAPSSEFRRLVGKWNRPDGGYVLQIAGVDASGKIEVAYFNPDPINVSKALALRDGQEVKIFVELRDVNYPGCTYSLKYDSKVDQLYGEYYQAAIKETFDVTFERLKE